jgi:hypothetical protein
MSMDNNQQPMPVKTDEPTTYDLVHKDLDSRKELGIKKYGVALQPNNGRNSLVDAYEEALDLVVYLRNEIAKNANLDINVLQMTNELETKEGELKTLKEKYHQLSELYKDELQHKEVVRRANDAEFDRLKGNLWVTEQHISASKAENQRLSREVERLSTQLNQLNTELNKREKWPKGFWNIVDQAWLRGWETRTNRRPDEVTKEMAENRRSIKLIFYEEKFPDEKA